MSNAIRILFVKTYGYAPNQAFDVPLGVLYLSGYLKKNLGSKVDVSLIDLRIITDKHQALKKKLREVKPHIIGISTLAFEHQFLSDNVEFIKAHAPDALLIIGGPYATSNAESILSENRIDYAIIGEGEKSLLKLVEAFAKGGDIRQVKGIAYKAEHGTVLTEKEDYIENLDSIPTPDYALIDFKDYWGSRLQFNGILAEKRHASVISSRACPYRCVYCHSMFGKKLRKRSAEHFVAEIRYLYNRYQVREFHIIDDVFNLDRPRMHEICNKIIQSGMTIKIAFPNGLRGDILEYEDILILKKAGAYMLTLAIESGAARIQTLIRKHLNIAKVMDNIAFAEKQGLITRGFFMLGFPGEEIAEMKLTVQTAIQSKLSMASFFVVVPFENTELHDMAKKHLDVMDKDLTGSYQSSTSFYEKATGYKVGRLQKMAYLRFYSPLRLIRVFLKIPRKSYQISKWFWFAFDLLRL
ncbi:MAG: B12-binding domain-containing radical SAM protein [Proteobacteria bacterium]|nr:B12-binding domain-containing radical SAM protein [Pseudomonadota bacterium]